MDKSSILSIDEKNFDSFTFDSDTPAIVFFNADRCGACKMLHPILEKMAEEYFDRLNIYSVDVDKHELLVQRFRLSGIPTILIFKDGEVARKIIGFHSKEALDKIIIHYLRNDFYVKENIEKQFYRTKI